MPSPAYNNRALRKMYNYDPFGKKTQELTFNTNVNSHFWYNFKEYDEESNFGEYYYGARFYDPDIGRFSSPDPVKSTKSHPEGKSASESADFHCGERGAGVLISEIIPFSM